MRDKPSPRYYGRAALGSGPVSSAIRATTLKRAAWLRCIEAAQWLKWRPIDAPKRGAFSRIALLLGGTPTAALRSSSCHCCLRVYVSRPPISHVHTRGGLPVIGILEPTLPSDHPAF